MKYLKKFNEEYMYTFNLFIYGIQMSENPDINNLLHSCDAEFSTKINGKRWEVNFPYHGGQCRGDVYSCIFGIQISDDDRNPNYVSAIRNSKEEDYIEDFKIFLDQYISYLDQNFGTDPEFDSDMKKIIDFIRNQKPCFYSVEASS